MNRRRHKLPVEQRFPYVHVGGSQDGQRFRWVEWCELYRLDGTRYVLDGYAELVRGTT